MVLGPGLRLLEQLADVRERLATGRGRVAAVDRLKIRRRLVPRAGQVVLARNLLHERLSVPAQALRGFGLHPATRPATMSRTRSDATRSCRRVSRSRIVTVLSCSV